MGGVQGGLVGCKDISCIRDYTDVVNSVTAKDLQLILTSLGVKEQEMFTAIGVSGKSPPTYE